MLKKITVIGGILCSSAYPFKVSICKGIEHDAINSVICGIKDSLKDQDIEYEIETCQGNSTLAYQIGAKFVKSKSDAIIAIGTVPAQCIFKYAKENKTKLVFSSVTNPKNISKFFQGSNTTGVSNFVDLKPQLELFKKIQPNLKNLGIIFNIGEANSVSIVEKLRIASTALGIKLIEQGIQKSSDIPQASSKLKNEVDAIFISNDNTALSGISYIIKLCEQDKIPVYVSDTDQVKKGCLAAFGPNQYKIGIQTGDIIKKIKDGKNINNIKIEYPKSTEIFINITAANKLGLSIPKDILKKADKIIEETSK